VFGGGSEVASGGKLSLTEKSGDAHVENPVVPSGKGGCVVMCGYTLSRGTQL
jgi:hypothetical protein